jgi:hypothetical protein
MRALLGMLPWGVVLVLVGAGTWFLYDRQIAGGAWLLAGLLIAHGAVHTLFLVPRPPATIDGPAWPFDMTRSWPVTAAGLDAGHAKAIAVVLIGAVIVGFTLAALATVGLVLPVAWWPALVAISAVLSLVLLGLCFHPQLLVGIALDLVLLWLAILTQWRPAIG